MPSLLAGGNGGGEATTAILRRLWRELTFVLRRHQAISYGKLQVTLNSINTTSPTYTTWMILLKDAESYGFVCPFQPRCPHRTLPPHFSIPLTPPLLPRCKSLTLNRLHVAGGTRLSALACAWLASWFGSGLTIIEADFALYWPLPDS